MPNLGSVLPPGSQLVVTSRLLPTFTVPLVTPPGEAEAPAWWLRALQPAVTVQIGGNTLGTVAPAGVPTSNYWGAFRWVAIGVGGFLAVKLLKGLL